MQAARSNNKQIENELPPIAVSFCYFVPLYPPYILAPEAYSLNIEAELVHSPRIVLIQKQLYQHVDRNLGPGGDRWPGKWF